jgi:tetratricopeptide (TPR) repeat protein
MNNNGIFKCLAAILAVSIYACGTVQTGPDGSVPVGLTLNDNGSSLRNGNRYGDSLTPEAVDRIETIIDRKTVLPRLEDLYLEIIRKNRNSPLAQECYLKLISMYVEDYSPPEFEKAEMMYKEFLKSYPRSILIHFMEHKLGRSYYENEDWNGLLQLTTPRYQKYSESDSPVDSDVLFMYSEANFHLGNMKEAEKGYARIAQRDPESALGIQAKMRLGAMRIQEH